MSTVPKLSSLRANALIASMSFAGRDKPSIVAALKKLGYEPPTGKPAWTPYEIQKIRKAMQ